MNHHKAEEANMPRRVSKRIVERCAQDEVAVVVPREGKPSRVYGLFTYIKMQEHPGKVQPWKYRKDRKDRQPDPLGAVDMGEILLPLTRERMYE